MVLDWVSCPEIACQKTIQNDNKCEKKIKTSPQERPALQTASVNNPKIEESRLVDKIVGNQKMNNLENSN